MATEAEAREFLLQTSEDLIYDVLAVFEQAERPLTGVEIEDITKKLFRITQTLKTAQSLSTV